MGAQHSLFMIPKEEHLYHCCTPTCTLFGIDPCGMELIYEEQPEQKRVSVVHSRDR